MNRAELQQLAEDRVLDAQALLAAGRWSAAYYLAGYGVECGLKSCVLAYVIRTGIIFQDKRYGERCFTHSFKELIKLADLEVVRGQDIAASPALGQSWAIAEAWAEISRYQQWTEAKTRQMVDAVSDPRDGVLSWIRKYW